MLFFKVRLSACISHSFLKSLYVMPREHCSVVSALFKHFLSLGFVLVWSQTKTNKKRPIHSPCVLPDSQFLVNVIVGFAIGGPVTSTQHVIL